MSVLIKGMEMPKCCAECSFLQEGVWKGKMYPCVCVAGGFVVKPSETDMRDGLCPLSKVVEPTPEHKTGKWLIRRFGSDAKCSECGMYFSDAYDLENSDAFCRNCGAKMLT